MINSDRKYKILIVEDDGHTRELLTYLMQDAGHETVTARNGEEALESLKKNTVDVIICDIMMPVMNGFAFRENVSANPQFRDIGFIFLSAKSLPEDEIKGLRYGVDEYVTKPFNPEVLAARVEAVIARRNSIAKTAQMDSLTQVYNRHTGEREIRRELERVQRYRSIGTLAFLDIDEFKQINDTKGHACGDRILIALADVLKQSIRSVDIVTRYGGEEFLIYFPETEEQAAISVLERMQQSFQQMTREDYDVSVSFSVGVVEAPAHGEVFSDLCGRADKAMYAAKNSGHGKTLSWKTLEKETV